MLKSILNDVNVIKKELNIPVPISFETKNKCDYKLVKNPAYKSINYSQMQIGNSK